MAQTTQYSKADLLALFRPIDVLPDGFTQWETVVSIACLEPENKAFPDFEIDPNSSVHPEFKPRPTLPSGRGISTPFAPRGRGRGRGRGRAAAMAAREAARDQETFGPAATNSRPKGSRFFDNSDSSDASFEAHQRAKITRKIAMDSQWYYRDSNAQVQGPFPLSKLVEWVDSYFKSPELLVKQDGDDDYLVLKDVIEACKQQAADTQSSAYDKQSSSAQGSPAAKQHHDDEDYDDEHAHAHENIQSVLDVLDDEPVVSIRSSPSATSKLLPAATKAATTPAVQAPQQPAPKQIPPQQNQGPQIGAQNWMFTGPQQTQPAQQASQQSMFAQYMNQRAPMQQPMQDEEKMLASLLQNQTSASANVSAPFMMQQHPIMHHQNYQFGVPPQASPWGMQMPSAHMHLHHQYGGHHPLVGAHQQQAFHAHQAAAAAAAQQQQMAISASQLEDQLTRAFQNVSVPPQQLQQPSPLQQAMPPQQQAPVVQQAEVASSPKQQKAEQKKQQDNKNKKKQEQAKKQQKQVKPAPVEEEEDEQDEQEIVEQQAPPVTKASPVTKKVEPQLTPEEIAYLPPTRKVTLEQFLPPQVQQQKAQQQLQQKSWANANAAANAPVAAPQQSKASLLEIQKQQALEAKKQKKESKKLFEEEQQKVFNPWGQSAQQAPATGSLAAIQAEQMRLEQEREAASNKAKAAQQKIIAPTAWGSHSGQTKSLEEIQREQKKKGAQVPQNLMQASAEKPLTVVAKKEAPAPAKSAWVSAAVPQAQPLSFPSKAKAAPASPVSNNKPQYTVTATADHEDDAGDDNDEDDGMFWSHKDTRYDEDEEPVAPQQPQPAVRNVLAEPSINSKQKKGGSKQQVPSGSYATAIGGQRAPQPAPSVFDKSDFPTLKTSAAPQAKPAAPKKSSDTVDNVNVSSDFKDWYKQGLDKFGKKYDSSLMKFLLSLKSEEEIDEYLAEYVGQSAAARDFIDEFKRFRSFELAGNQKGGSQQGSSAGSKKKKKQQAKQDKKIDPALLGFGVAKRPGMVQSADEIEDD